MRRKINIKNYNKPTPKVYKYIADFGLLMIPTVHLILGGAPEGTFTPFQVWVIGGTIDFLAVGFKFITKLMGEPEESEQADIEQ